MNTEDDILAIAGRLAVLATVAKFTAVPNVMVVPETEPTLTY